MVIGTPSVDWYPSMKLATPSRATRSKGGKYQERSLRWEMSASEASRPPWVSE